MTSFDPNRLQILHKHLSAYVDREQLPGWELALTHGPDVVFNSQYGWRDPARQIPMDGGTLFRIASMTKPLTSVVAMTLWEEGVFELTDPISRWLPEFADLRVYDKGTAANPHTVPAQEPVRVWHLLAHASGLSVGFIRTHVVDELYRSAGFEFGIAPGRTLAACVRGWAALPLRFEPGTAWGYGVSTDVLGHLIELWTGQSLEDAFTSRLTGPLSMTDTVFHIDAAQAARVPPVYEPDPRTGKAVICERAGSAPTAPPTAYSGGGGLLSTVADYTRFTRMLAQEGVFEGQRILAPSTVRLMRQNHLAGDLQALSTGGFAETSFDGVGFGLGFATVLDPVRLRTPSNAGEFYWGGAFSTAFWVDPVTRISCTFMTSLFPSSALPIRSQLRQLVYSALVD